MLVGSGATVDFEATDFENFNEESFGSSDIISSIPFNVTVSKGDRQLVFCCVAEATSDPLSEDLDFPEGDDDEQFDLDPIVLTIERVVVPQVDDDLGMLVLTDYLFVPLLTFVLHRRLLLSGV